MRLNRTQRLLVAIAFTVVTLAFLWRPYRDALHQINRSLLINISSDDTQAADDEPRGDRRRLHCSDSIWPGYLWCGEPAHPDTPQVGDDKPSGDRMWRQCQDSVWPGYLWCGEPWHSGSPPWEDR